MPALASRQGLAATQSDRIKAFAKWPEQALPILQVF